MLKKTLAVLAVAALAGSGSAFASTLTATAALTPELYTVDTTTGQSTLVGTFKFTSKNELGLPVLARASDGTLYGVSSSNLASRIYSINESTAQLASVHQIQSSPVLPAGAAIDPTDGSLWFTNTFGFVWWPALTRVDLGTGVETGYGNIGPVNVWYLGLAFDSAGNLYTLNTSNDTLWKVDKLDPLNNSVAVGTGLGAGISLAQGGTLSFDASSGQMIGYEASGGRFFTIDLATGTASVFGASPITPQFADIAGSTCPGSVIPYGAGCAGTGGFVPNLAMLDCPTPGQQVTLELTQTVAPTTALFFIGLNQVTLPAGGGCNLHVAPVLVSFSVPVGGSGPGAGSVSLPGIIPLAAAGATFTMQAWAIDPASAIGGVSTNGLEVTVAP